jgi:hypothetical protein
LAIVGSSGLGAEELAAGANEPPPSTIPLRIIDPFTSERRSRTIYLSGGPKGARFTDGTHAVQKEDVDDVVNLTGWNLGDLVVQLPPEPTDSFILSVVAIDLARDPPTQPLLQVQVASRGGKIPGTAELNLVPGRLDLPVLKIESDQPELPTGQAETTATPAAMAPKPQADPASTASLAGAPKFEVNALIVRAERLIHLGNIAGARTMLEQVLPQGDPRAAFLLGQTYDPRVLRVWNVYGIRGDPDRARELYAKAEQGGYTASK